MAVVRDPFTDALADPKVLVTLRSNRDIAEHMLDEDFKNTIEQLHYAAKRLPKDPTHIDWTAMGCKAASEAFADPRVMQAIMTLYGYANSIRTTAINTPLVEHQLKREPLQKKHLVAVEDSEDVDETKASGNEHFKSGDHAMALAHYQRAITIVRMSREEMDWLKMATLVSNASLCLVKLEFPDRAKTSLTQVLRALDKLACGKTFDKTKLFHRRGLACEQLEEFSMAEDDMKRALKEAQRNSLGDKEEKRCRGEIARMQKLHDKQIADLKKDDNNRGYWGAFVKKDAVAEYEEANKWSHGHIDERFADNGVEIHFDKWGNRITADNPLTAENAPDAASAPVIVDANATEPPQ